MKKDTLCVMPWIHINSEPDGRVIPCCVTTDKNYVLGNLKTDSIDSIWNSSNMKQLRVEMISGNEPSICKPCFNLDRVNDSSSFRSFQNNRFSNNLKNIPNITLADGTCTEIKLKYWDFRFSNLCNFKCRSCGPNLSSSWVPDATKLGQRINEGKLSTTVINFDLLKEQLNHVEEIYFAGGEPLLMPEHWAILDMLIEHKKFDVNIRYNTNCSTLTYGKKDIFDYWSKWNPGKIRVGASIDEIGNRAELIRSGTAWQKVEDNLKKLSNCEFLNSHIYITVSVFNVFRLPEIITYLSENKIIKNGKFFLNILVHPDYYQVQILPENVKQDIIKKIILFVEIYSKKYSIDLSWHFKYLFSKLSIPNNQDQIDKFKDITEKLDKIRNENTYETIPELKVLL